MRPRPGTIDIMGTTGAMLAAAAMPRTTASVPTPAAAAAAMLAHTAIPMPQPDVMLSTVPPAAPAMPDTEAQLPRQPAAPVSSSSPVASCSSESSVCDPIELEAARKLSYMLGIQQRLEAIPKSNQHVNTTFGSAFIHKPVGARFKQWKAAFLGDMTVTVAEVMATSNYCDSTPNEQHRFVHLE